jgi:anti-sigma regulatory factor (Ser/Thr protein kinase)
MDTLLMREGTSESGPKAGSSGEDSQVPLLASLSQPLTAAGKVCAGAATIRTTDDVEPVLQVLLDALQRNGFSISEIVGIHHCLTEAIRNAVQHGHRGDASKQVRLRYLINALGLLVQVEDEGPGFRAAQVLSGPAAENQEQGLRRGLRLIQRYMTEVRFNPCGNCITMIKRRTPVTTS